MKIVSYKKKSPNHYAFDRRPSTDASVETTVRKIIDEVKFGGDQALVSITNRFVKPGIDLQSIKLTRRPHKPQKEVIDAMKSSLKNIQLFSRQRIPRGWKMKNNEGATIGEQFFPLKRVGLYVPGGTAPLVSTALMTVGIAKTAGVKEIVVCTPPPVMDDLLYAIHLAGATEVYGVGGAQAIAAMAYGTQTIKRVEKIVGPGNAYVVEAKRQVFGMVDIDSIPGPSEVAIVADSTCQPSYVASDLLAQAEHGKGSQIYLISPERETLLKVQTEMMSQLKELPRQEYLQETLEKGCILIEVDSLDDAIEVAEKIAPEHLSLACRQAKRLAGSIRNAGAVFVGDYSPVAVGDYAAGPSHTLPTGGAARFFSGLTVTEFFKRVSLVHYTRKELKKGRKVVETLASIEQLEAHAQSIRARFES